MGQLTNVTNITSASSGVQVDTLTGWTRVVSPSQDLPAGSVSTAYLCQTNDGVAATVRLDSTSTPWANSQTYYRTSFAVRLIKTDNEIGTAPGNATLLTVREQKSGGTAYRSTLFAKYAPPSAASPNLSRYTQNIGAINLSINAPAYPTIGPEGVINHTESGALYRSSTGSATSPDGGTYTANFPIGQWMRVTFIYDYTAKRHWLLINGHICGFNSMNAATIAPNVLNSDANGPTTDWTVTFPAWAGFRWHLCEMSSWGDTAIANDTGLTPISDARNWRTWSLSPTFMDVATGGTGAATLSSLVSANCTRSYIPYSLSSGNRPLRERLRMTTTSASGVTASFFVANAPIEWNSDGLFNVCTNIRLGSPSSGSNGNTWVWSGQFTGVSPSFNIAYSSGAYRMTDAAGTELGSWAINELVQIVWTLNRNGTCAVTVFNQSKDSTATAPTSVRAALAASDAVPTSTFGFVGNFSATVSGDLAEMEAWEGYRNFAFLVADSYVEAALQGTSAYTVSTFTTAYRATINEASLLNMSDNSADCNPHGCMTFPQGPNCPRWAFAGAWGRSGKRWTNWVTTSLPGLNCLQGATCLLLGGLANDMSAASDSATSISTASTLASQTAIAAKYFLDRNGTFVWIRPTFPYYRPDLTYPTSPFAGQWPYDCFVRSLSAITTALTTVQRTHPKGYRCVIADAGMVDFADGIHWGNEGTVPAFVSAAPQVAAALGESYPQGSTSASPGQSNLKAGSKKKLLVIPQ